MGYEYRHNETVQEGLRRIAREQIDDAIDEINDPEIDDHVTVHEVRKNCKKIRGLIRLVRPCFEHTYREENAWFRDNANQLSFVRDSQSIIETFEKLMQRFENEIDTGRFEQVLNALVVRRRKVAEEESRIKFLLQQFKKSMLIGRERVINWKLMADSSDAIALGVSKTYMRGQKAMTLAYEKPALENFHEWRKRVKYHWYHLRLLLPIWSEMMTTLRDDAHLLSDYLGDDHDLGILKQTIEEYPDEFGGREILGELSELIVSRQSELRKSAHKFGRRMYAENSKCVGRKLANYWEVWKVNEEMPQRELTTDDD